MTAVVPPPPPPFSAFAALLGEVEREALAARVEAAFAAAAKAKDDKYSAGQTFWMPAREQPQDLLERYVQAVFERHTRHLPAAALGPEAGAEWWPLVMESARRDEVGLHYDKDYGSEDLGLHLYPLLGTVTYLCGCGAPTLFLQHCEGDGAAAIPRAWLSRVEPGKHVTFDGRLLHCAPSQLVQQLGLSGRGGGGGLAGKAGKRVTLLVNVWTSHKPLDCIRWTPPCPEPDVALRLQWPDQPDAVPVLDVAPQQQQPLERVEMELGGTKLVLVMHVDVDAVVASVPATSVELRFAEPSLCQLQRRAKSDKKKKKKDAKKKKDKKKTNGKGKKRG